jgi:hypothetical protein
MQREEIQPVDLANEIKLMAGFVSARWDNVEHVEALFQDLAQVAQKTAVDGLPDRAVTAYLYEKLEEREVILKQVDKSGGLLRYYDQPYLLLDNVRVKLHDYESAKRETRYDADCLAYKGFPKLVSTYPRMKKAQPTGLRAMLEHCRADNEIWDKALEDEYTDSHSFASALPRSGVDFARDISLISVVQMVDHHSEPAVDLLVSSAYKHLARVVTNNNACEVIADLAKLEPGCKREEPVFELVFEPEHPITQALVQLAKQEWRGLGEDDPEQEYLAAVEDHKTRKPLTEEEKRANKAKAFEMVSSLWKASTKRSK